MCGSCGGDPGLRRRLREVGAAAGPRRRASVRMSGWADERGGEGDGRIYVGNLPTDVREKDLEDLFYKYGRIREIELKNRHGLVPFAFVRFEDPR